MTKKASGLPPVINFGSKELQQRIVPDVLAGKKYISLAISEAFAGSDVAGIRTVATKTDEYVPFCVTMSTQVFTKIRSGKHWIINGTKK